MHLPERLCAVTLEALATIDVLSVSSEGQRSADIIRFLCDKGILTTAQIDSALKKAAFAHARSDYARMTTPRPSPLYPDHLGSTANFAYAIREGAFSAHELESVPFDHGDTPESFAQDYAQRNYIQTLREQLLNPERI